MPRLTKSIALSRTVSTLYHHIEKNADGSPLRARMTGKLKEWRRPHSPQWQLPMKHGLKGSFYINDTTADEWFTVEDEARLFHLGVTVTDAQHHMVPAGHWYHKVAGVAEAGALGPRHFPSFEEALKYSVERHLPVVAPKWMVPWAIVEVQLDGRSVFGELVSFPTHDRTIMVRLIPGDPNSLTEVPLSTILRTSARMKWVHYAEVSGNFGFPSDMLRYDNCHPVNFTIGLDDAPILSDGWPPGSALMVAATGSTRSRSPFTLARWQSFSWSCRPCRTEKIGA